MRLSKYLAEAGVASRRKCEEIIFKGLVTVNGEVVKTPQTLVGPSDGIKVKGKLIAPPEEKVYYMLNKPKGYLCSSVRPTPNSRLAIDLVPDDGKRLFTVGRLDKDTEGLIFITNDGDFANRAIHPSSNLVKVYIAKTDQEITLDHLKTISKGGLVEGTRVVPVSVTKMRRNTLKMTLKEGKKREVRVLIERSGMDVVALKRVQIGPVILGLLPLGHYKPLSQKQIDSF